MLTYQQASPSVIPVLGTGIQSSAGAAASCEMDPGHKARDDNAEITQ